MAQWFRLRLLLLVIAVTAAVAAPLRCMTQDEPRTLPTPNPAETPGPTEQGVIVPPVAKPESPLDRILATLEANVADYTHSVPNFLCKEHVVSRMEPTPNPSGFLSVATDSVFRVHRTARPDGRTYLEESRVLTAVNGKPPPATESDETSSLLSGPMAVYGIFSGGLNLVSTAAKECFRYKLHPARPNHPAEKTVIEFEDLPSRERDPGCPYTDKISGRAVIQTSTMRVLHLEAKMRDHPMQSGPNAVSPEIKETWEWSVDYAPVTLGGKTFWLPSTIHSNAIPNAAGPTDYTQTNSGGGRRGGGTQVNGTPPVVTYTLTAKYTDYHRLTVVSRIVPTNGAGDAPPDSSPTASPADPQSGAPQPGVQAPQVPHAEAPQTEEPQPAPAGSEQPQPAASGPASVSGRNQ